MPERFGPAMRPAAHLARRSRARSPECRNPASQTIILGVSQCSSGVQAKAPMHIARLSHFPVKSAKTGIFVGFGRLTGGFVDVGTGQPFHRKLIRQSRWAESLNPTAF